MYLDKRPKNWAVKPNPNRWFNNANMNSFHKEAPRYKHQEPSTIYKNFDKNPNHMYVMN